MCLTKAEHVMLQLDRFKIYRPQRYNMPYGMTQDGIAIAVGISRAHVSLVLKGLKEKGLADFEECHALKDMRARRVYYLTYNGRELIKNIEEKMQREGIDKDSLFSNCPQSEANGYRPQLEIANIQLCKAIDQIQEIKTGNAPEDTYGIILMILDAVKALSVKNGVKI